MTKPAAAPRIIGIVLVIVTVVTLGVPGAMARPGRTGARSSTTLLHQRDATAMLPPTARPVLRSAESRMGALRSAFGTHSFSSMTEALLAVRGNVTRNAGRLTVPGKPRMPELPGLPRPLRAKLSGLSASVRSAVDLLGLLPKKAVASDFPRIMHSLSSRTGGVAAARSSPQRRMSLSPATRHALAMNPRALLLLATALDRALPRLTDGASAPRSGTASTAVAACDVVDDPPWVCVSSPADNTYGASQNYVLQIDQGGNDTYENGAGAAPFLWRDRGVYIPVSVAIDLGGNDIYSPRVGAPDVGGPTTDFGPSVLADGFGTEGGIGMLIDVAGDDQYVAAASEPGPIPGASSGRLFSTTSAQGMGAAGTGLLFDLAGDDSYTLTGTDGVDDNVGLFGQGATGGLCGVFYHLSQPGQGPVGGGCSLGLLADFGETQDSYRVDAGTGTSESADPPTSRGVAAQGFGVFGAGVLYDGGGPDDFSLAASVVAKDADGRSRYGTEAGGAIYGQGYGQRGTGLLLEGSGPTSYVQSLAGNGITSLENKGQGFGTLAGTGVLDDLGGDDDYRLTNEQELSRQITVDDSCRNESGLVCPSAEALVAANSANKLWGQGAAVDSLVVPFAGPSLGFLRDHSGSDNYLAKSTRSLQATLQDDLSAPQGPSHLQAVGFPIGNVLAEGAVLAEGSGLLLDESGTDTYTLGDSAEVSASASSAHAQAAPVVRSFALAPAQGAVGQGGVSGTTGQALGALLDLGGVGDRFVGVVNNSASAAPDPSGAYESGFGWPAIGGVGAPGALLVALGEAPSIVTAPSGPACYGERGGGQWSGSLGSVSNCEVWDQLFEGTGSAPAAVGSPPKLSFTQETPSSAPEDSPAVEEDRPWATWFTGEEWLTPSTDRIPVGILLTDAGGKPLADTLVHVTLQQIDYQSSSAVPPAVYAYPQVSNMWQVDVRTDADGVARAMVPLWGARESKRDPLFGTGLFSNQVTYRLAAIFDGTGGLRPAYAFRPLTLTH